MRHIQMVIRCVIFDLTILEIEGLVSEVNVYQNKTLIASVPDLDTARKTMERFVKKWW